VVEEAGDLHKVEKVVEPDTEVAAEAVMGEVLRHKMEPTGVEEAEEVLWGAQFLDIAHPVEAAVQAYS
jgi:hypothetical protein